MVILRQATEVDLGSILTIYNQGIEDRIATLETQSKDAEYMYEWFKKHQGRYTVLVALDGRPLMYTTLEVLMTVSVTFQSIYIVIIEAKGSASSCFRN